ncbi:MAG: putative Fe-S cluster assembly protein SufT [Myxococcota bacterium]|nr:putative Fe-S cluster assembly protein SufT [Myxococcota bacterium]
MAMEAGQSITLERDCPGIQVPFGNPITIPSGMGIVVEQALGDSVTVMTHHGVRVRIEAKDFDALGMEAEASTLAEKPESGPVNEEMIWDVLKTIYDPEIPVDIVELGLIYSVGLNCAGEEKWVVDVKMTLTAPGCGMSQVLHDDVVRKVEKLTGVEEVKVELVFDPPWDPSKMSDAARLKLDMF